MGYSRAMYVGWYAEFDRSTLKEQDGVKLVRKCPNGKKHPTNGEFCPTCGAKIEFNEVPTYRSIALPGHILGENDPAEIKYMTLGRADHWDLGQLGDCYAVFPEFLGTTKMIIMAPGYIRVDGGGDGFVQEVPTAEGGVENHAPDANWSKMLEKVFDAQNIKIKFGVALEIM